jgi:XTP/dITP diphosphohydrolase
MEAEKLAFERLLKIMDELREQCPWDMKQTLQTLRHLTIEETYELSDAILNEDLNEIKKELGDVLLHIVFYARIGKEKHAFDMTSIIDGLCEKLIRRHPHIYGDPDNSGKLVIVENEADVKRNWEQIKLKEGNKSVLGGVPNSLPALLKATRIQDKAKGVGFDWENSAQVWEKVQEEIQELQVEIKTNNKEKIEDEFGDVLFSLINYARFLEINPEDALERTNKKFIFRFQHLENKAKEMGKELKDMTLSEMDIFWNEAKKVH